MKRTIQGNIIDEIKSLPKTEMHRFIVDRAETKLNNGEITEENALDMCTTAILDYYQNKRQIAEDLNNNHKITIIDSIMGSGKSTFLIQLVNKNPQKKYIIVVPSIDEISRYRKDINRKSYAPFVYTDNITKEFANKTKCLQELIAEGKSPIIATHQLIYHLNQTTIDLLKKTDYELIIDECLQCVDIYRRKGFYRDDLRTLTKSIFGRL